MRLHMQLNQLQTTYIYIYAGQVGRRPCIQVWFTESSNASISGDLPDDSFIIAVGNGFFERAVNAVEISFDNTLVIGIGEDDKHKLGIWDIASGLLLAGKEYHTRTYLHHK